MQIQSKIQQSMGGGAGGRLIGITGGESGGVLVSEIVGAVKSSPPAGMIVISARPAIVSNPSFNARNRDSVLIRIASATCSGVAVVQDRAMEAEADRMGQRAAAHTATVQAKPTPVTRGVAPVARRPFVRTVVRSTVHPGSTQGAVQRSAPVRVSGMMPVGDGSYRIVVGAGGQPVGSVMVHNRDKSALEVT